MTAPLIIIIVIINIIKKANESKKHLGVPSKNNNSIFKDIIQIEVDPLLFKSTAQ